LETKWEKGSPGKEENSSWYVLGLKTNPGNQGKFKSVGKVGRENEKKGVKPRHGHTGETILP